MYSLFRKNNAVLLPDSLEMLNFDRVWCDDCQHITVYSEAEDPRAKPLAEAWDFRGIRRLEHFPPFRSNSSTPRS